jgi:hypothetical protein
MFRDRSIACKDRRKEKPRKSIMEDFGMSERQMESRKQPEE